MSKAQTTEPQTVFNSIPATIRRNAFLQGRLSLPTMFRPRTKTAAVQADRTTHKAKVKDWSAPGGNRLKLGRAKLQNALSLSRLTRKQRNRMLAQKCRAAGVTNACALALAK